MSDMKEQLCERARALAKVAERHLNANGDVWNANVFVPANFQEVENPTILVRGDHGVVAVTRTHSMGSVDVSIDQPGGARRVSVLDLIDAVELADTWGENV